MEEFEKENENTMELDSRELESAAPATEPAASEPVKAEAPAFDAPVQEPTAPEAPVQAEPDTPSSEPHHREPIEALAEQIVNPNIAKDSARENMYNSETTEASDTSGAGAGNVPPVIPPRRPSSYDDGYGRSKARGVSRAAFIIILIIAMLVTMLASVAASMFYMSHVNSTNNEATNYTLTSSDETLSYKSIIKKAEKSIVSITTEAVANDIWAQNYVTQGAGSGVIITKDGYIITCEHVISGASRIKVTLNDGKEHDAEVIGADAANDIAVIKIKATGLQPATYGDSSKLEVGDQVVAIGNPLGTLSGTATTGIISALNRNLQIEDRTLNLFQTDASINPGNSGGGMFDASGNLIGIVEAKSTGSDVDGLGFATPINKAAKIAKQIIKKGDDISSGSSNDSRSSGKTAIIGIMVSDLSDDIAKEYGYKQGGVLIKSVTSTEADEAGLKSGDVIIKAGGKEIKDQNDLSSVMSKKKPGDKLKLTLASPNGNTREVTTELIKPSLDY